MLHGESVDWTPVSINFAQWYGHHKKYESLPEEIRDLSYIQAMKFLGCDIFSRNHPAGLREKRAGVEIQETESVTQMGRRVTSTFHTPKGKLISERQEQKEQSTWHDEVFLVKDWEEDGEAYRSLLESAKYEWDESVFESIQAEIGDDGIFNLPVWGSPLKRFHHDFGLEGTCYFLMDEPEQAKELAEIYWANLRPCLIRMSEHPEVHSIIIMDNLDTPFYPGSLTEEFWTPYVRDAAQIMKENGKSCWVHACGQLVGMLDEVKATRVTGLEGIAHPTLGDTHFSKYLELTGGMIYNGGFSAMEQRMETREELEKFYEDFFKDVVRNRFMMASACNTSVFTPWERIKEVVEITRAWGGSPY